MTDFLSQIRRHIGFLERSCASYDEGHFEEALRIATSLRVLFHDTRSSTSLLTHLGIKSSVLVLSTFQLGYRKNKETGTFTASIPVFLDKLGGSRPAISRSQRHEFISVSEWWSEIIAFMHDKLSRKDIVLAAANKDGGVHVDARPDKKTQNLIKGFWTIKREVCGKVIEQRLDKDHLSFLRQFAYEVLNSPDISRR